MALFLLQPGLHPLGDFDLLDTDQSSVLGGEVMVLDEASRTITSTEKAAYDVLDGYIADEVTEATTRVVARIADEASETYDVFYLSDEGTTHYGVTFGSVVGGPVGLSTTSTNLGPHTTTGSGKVTLWDKGGLYAVSLDAVSSDVVPTTSGNLYDTPLPGTVLYRETLTGKLCRATGTSDKIAAFVELTNNGSMVNTPARLVGASETFDRIKIQYFGAHHNA
jgi:hypothetical protein